MAYTYSQFDDELVEIAAFGREGRAGDVLLREVTLKNGERFAVDVELIFPSIEAAEAAEREASRDLSRIS